MTFSQRLVHVEAVALFSLFARIGFISALLAVLVVFSSQSDFKADEIVLVTVIGGGIVGVPLVALYGAPLYAYLCGRMQMSWPIALLVGAAPGLLLLPTFGVDSIMWAALGAAVALMTHAYICVEGWPDARSNTSLERTRGR
jgi:hypothetical protein